MNAKQRKRIQDRLGALRRQFGAGRCWVCGSVHGVKTSRAGYATRCRACLKANTTNAAVREYDRLKRSLASGKRATVD